MTSERLTRNFVLLRALRWLPLGLVLPFLVITPEARGLSLGAIGAVFAVHSAVAIALEVPSGSGTVSRSPGSRTAQTSASALCSRSTPGPKAGRRAALSTRAGASASASNGRRVTRLQSPSPPVSMTAHVVSDGGRPS